MHDRGFNSKYQQTVYKMDAVPFSICEEQQQKMAPLRSLFPVSQLFSASPTTKFINYAVVDAFTDTPFKGNPAGVCFLPAWQETHWMQQVASELNLNMTAFLVSRQAGCNGAIGGTLSDENKDCTSSSLDAAYDFNIRWFTPLSEVDLCGHATLASSYLLFGSGIVSGNMIRFHPEKGGVLYARRVERTSKEEFLVELNFPILPSYECNSELAVLSSTLQDLTPVSFHKTIVDDLVELPSGEDVEALKPCFDEIRKCSSRGVIVTGPGSEESGCDFISRFFAPKVGVDEDPVCGQAHCALAAFWAKKLKKDNLIAYQASKRGGTLCLRVDFEASRVYLQGEATLVMSGVLFHECNNL